MTVEQRPIHRKSLAAESPYAAFAAAQFRILKDYMKVAKLNTYSRVVTLANGVVITCQKSFNREDVFVYVPPVAVFTEEVSSEVFSSFIFNPRVFGRNDGYKLTDGELLEEGSGLLDYPLIDDDELSTSLKATDTKITSTRELQLYGNIDWIGPRTTLESDVSDAVVLTWKGPTGRSIPFDYDKEIPGMTTPDIKFDLEGADYFTCFGPNIYRAGIVAVSAPVVGDIAPKVLGAAVTAYTVLDVEKTAYVCVVNNHYVDLIGFFDEVWITHGSPGLYDQDTNPNGWEKLNSVASSRPTQCWFFNQSGTKATMGDTELSINVATKEVSSDVMDAGSGTYTANKVGTLVTITHSGAYHLYSDYKGDTRVTARITINDSVSRTIDSETTDVTEEVDIYTLGEPEPFTAVIVGPDVYTSPSDYSVVGSWGSCCTGEEVAVWPTGCGTGTISITYCGNTITKQVRMPEGVWKLVEEKQASCWYPGKYPSYTPCTTLPCMYFSIPAAAGCGYTWTTWDGRSQIDIDYFQTQEDPELTGGNTKIWRWAAADDTTSTLGQARSPYNNQLWVCVLERKFEWWCTNTTKGW